MVFIYLVGSEEGIRYQKTKCEGSLEEYNNFGQVKVSNSVPYRVVEWKLEKYS